ncbi:MAG: hypothetical protein WBP47_22810, partial [Candidatus Promineifilaceae bacterium]
MTIQNRFGSRNPLLRHVRRHANTTTLFRTPSADEPMPPSGVVFPAWAVPTAVSSPPLPDVVDSAVAYAERSAGPASPVQPTILSRPTAVPPAASQPAAPTVIPTVQRTAVPQPAQFSPAPPATISPPAASLSTPPPAKEDDWPEWRRLESIVQRHKARQSAETVTPELPTAVSPAPSDTLARAVATAESGQLATAPPGRLPLEA